LILQPHFDLFGDRYSEREEKRQHGRLRTQAEAEEAKKKKEAEDKAKLDVSANTTAQILSNM
jgi:arsenic resistance protein ArsH